MTRQFVVCSFIVVVAIGWGCGSPAEMPDAQSPDTNSSSGRCTSDVSCDDGNFCDGPERCMPSDPGANAHGCVATPPCVPSQRCDEAMDRCVTSCAVNPDADGDHVDSVECMGADCDDADPHRFPGNPEVCDVAGHDEDCDPHSFGGTDADQDGFVSARCCNTGATATEMFCGDDCDDVRRDSHPGATEACEGIDNDCDTAIDEGLLIDEYPDLDFDLHGTSDVTMHHMVCPGAPGWSTTHDDCDETSSVIYGGFVEICDGIDNDCDTRIDENPAPTTWYPDQDADGFGAPPSDPTMLRVVCIPPGDGYSVRSSDCNDHDAMVHPGAHELCNGRDDDCNGLADAPGTSAGDTEDDDRDGFGDVVCGGNDCDDAVATTHPHAQELCNMTDDDCDGVVDGASAMANWYLDLDHDGFGDASSPPIMSCTPQPSRVAIGLDCDDARADVHPGVADPCSVGTPLVDEDCDGQFDESGVRFAFYPDADADGWGTTDRSGVLFRCSAPTGMVGRSGDCADTNPARFPAATETCNVIDDDCDTTVDEDSMQSWYVDADHDGHGVGTAIVACTMPAGRVNVGDDCDDANGGNFPGNTEACNGRDDDCDTMIDDGASTACAALVHSSGVCTAGACTLACATGYQDCDGAIGTGCETDTRRSPATCGTCTNVCHPGDTCGVGTPGTCDLSPVIQVTGGNDWVLALRASGGVAAWGSGASSDLTSAVTTPVPATTVLTGIVRVDASSSNWGLALTAAHTVLSWGNDNQLQLGDGLSTTRGVPLPIAGVSNVVSISTGANHGCVVQADGTVYCWGGCSNGQCGQGDRVTRPTPVRVMPFTDAVEVSATNIGTCVRHGSAGVFHVTCWGPNLNALLGLGTSGGSDQLSPGADVIGLPTNLAELAVIEAHDAMCAVTTDGLLYCWGENTMGTLLGLGTGSPGIVTAASQVPGLTNVTHVAIGTHGGCAIRRGAAAGSSELWCWGSSATIWIPSAAAGMFDMPTATLQPTIVNPVSVSVGSQSMCAALADGTVVCTGSDNQGQLGNGAPNASSQAPVRALLLP
jgi:alpha-tubulin suppressor-like RCC1 family protein